MIDEIARSGGGPIRRDPITKRCGGVKQKLLYFRTSHFIDRLIELSHDVKAIEDVQGIGCFLGNDLEIRRPHVAADIFDLGAALFTESRKNRSNVFTRRSGPHQSNRLTPALS